MKKVNPKEIDKLYKFTSRHYVKYYDIQTELVDHLANAIEEQWKSNPELPFEDALQAEFKKFGVFGFMDLVETRQKIAQKSYLKLIGKESLKFMAQGKILFIMVVISFLGYFLLQFTHGLEILMGIVTLELFALIFIIARRKSKYEKNLKNSGGRRLLLEEVIETAGHSAAVFPLVISFFNLLFNADIYFPEQLYGSIGLALITSSQFFLVYMAFFQLPKKKDKILRKVYPELQTN